MSVYCDGRGFMPFVCIQCRGGMSCPVLVYCDGWGAMSYILKRVECCVLYLYTVTSGVSCRMFVYCDGWVPCLVSVYCDVWGAMFSICLM